MDFTLSDGLREGVGKLESAHFSYRISWHTWQCSTSLARVAFLSSLPEALMDYCCFVFQQRTGHNDGTLASGKDLPAR